MDSETSLRASRSQERIPEQIYGSSQRSPIYERPHRTSYYDQKEDFSTSSRPVELYQSPSEPYSKIQKATPPAPKHKNHSNTFKDKPLPPEPRISPLNSSTESIMEDTSPRKERRKYDKEMVETEISSILKTERGAKFGEDGRRSRVEFVEPQQLVRDSSTSPIGDILNSTELKANAPIVGEEDFGTPRSSKSSRRIWVEKPKKIDIVPERIEEVKPKLPSEGKYSREAAMMEIKESERGAREEFSGPVCLEAREFVDFLPKKTSTDGLALPKKNADKSDGFVKSSRVTSESEYLVPKSKFIEKANPDSSKLYSTYFHEPSTSSHRLSKVEATSSEDVRVTRSAAPFSSQKIDQLPPTTSPKPAEAFVHRMSLSPERQPAMTTFKPQPRPQSEAKPEPQSTRLSHEKSREIPINTQFSSKPRPRSSSKERPLVLPQPFMTKEREEIQETSKITKITTSDPIEKVKLSQTASEQLAKTGWISPLKTFKSTLNPTAKEDDDWPLPPAIPQSYSNQEKKPNQIPTSLRPKSSLSTSEGVLLTENYRPRSSAESFEESSHFKSFSEQLKAQFSHSPSNSISSHFGVTSPGPKATSSPMPPPPIFPTSPRSSFREKLRESTIAGKPPLPPGSRQRNISLTKLEQEPKGAKPNLSSATETSIHADSTFSPVYSSFGHFTDSPPFIDDREADDEPSFDLSGIGRSIIDPRIRVVSEGTKLHILGM